MATQAGADVVADPVARISISGVHGRDELKDRMARIAPQSNGESEFRQLLLGAAIGATIMYLLKR